MLSKSAWAVFGLTQKETKSPNTLLVVAMVVAAMVVVAMVVATMVVVAMVVAMVVATTATMALLTLWHRVVHDTIPHPSSILLHPPPSSFILLHPPRRGASGLSASASSTPWTP